MFFDTFGRFFLWISQATIAFYVPLLCSPQASRTRWTPKLPLKVPALACLVPSSPAKWKPCAPASPAAPATWTVTAWTAAGAWLPRLPRCSRDHQLQGAQPEPRRRVQGRQLGLGLLGSWINWLKPPTAPWSVARRFPAWPIGHKEWRRMPMSFWGWRNSWMRARIGGFEKNQPDDLASVFQVWGSAMIQYLSTQQSLNHFQIFQLLFKLRIETGSPCTCSINTYPALKS